jgi:hypothetical protein
MNKDLKIELKEIHSFLDKIDIQKNNVNYKDVPEGYFDSMEDSFFANLQKESNAKHISIFTKFHLSYAIASIVTFAFIGYFAYSILNKDTQKFNLSENEVHEYLQENYEEIEEEELLAMIKDTEIKKAINDSLNNVSENDIKSYLIEKEGVDLINIEEL